MPAKDLVPFSTYLPKETKKKLDKLAKNSSMLSAAAIARMIIVNNIDEFERRLQDLEGQWPK